MGTGMPAETRAAVAWRSGEFVLRPAQRRLLRDGKPADVEERVFDLIALLVANHERAMDQREITAALWGPRPVSDGTLRQLVHKARRALDDDGDRQHTIRTQHGRSLQWVAPLEMVYAEAAESAATPVSVAPRLQARKRARWISAAAAIVLSLIAVGVWIDKVRAPDDAPLPRVAIEPFDNATGDASLDWVKNGLPGLLGSLVEQGGGLDVVSTSQVARASTFKPTQGRDREQQLRFVTGADTLISGKLTKLADMLYELNLQVQSADGSNTKIKVEGEQPGVLAADAVVRVRHELGPTKSRPPVGALPRDPFLAEAFARGLDLLVQGKPDTARPYFEMCVAKAPGFLPALFYLGVAQRNGVESDVSAQTLKQLLTQARQRGDVGMMGLALLELGVESRQGLDVSAARSYLTESIAYLHRANDVDGQIKAYAFLTTTDAKLARFSDAQDDLQKAQELLAQHSNVHYAATYVSGAKGMLALQLGDPIAALAAFQHAMESREAEGNFSSVTNDAENIGAALLNAHFPAQAITVLAHVYRLAKDAKSWSSLHSAGADLSNAMLAVGLAKRAENLASIQLDLDRLQQNIAWQRDDWVIRSVAELAQGDYTASLTSLHTEAMLADAHDAPALGVSDKILYKAIAAFRTDPARLPSIGSDFDKFAQTHRNAPGVVHCAYLLDALTAAADGRQSRAIASLQAAAAVPPNSSDGDTELRMAPLLIALAEHSEAAAAIALKGYDPATTNDASLLPLYIQWTRQQDDKTNQQRAETRLAQLRKQGEDALVAAGLDPNNPFESTTQISQN